MNRRALVAAAATIAVLAGCAPADTQVDETVQPYSVEDIASRVPATDPKILKAHCRQWLTTIINARKSYPDSGTDASTVIDAILGERRLTMEWWEQSQTQREVIEAGSEMARLGTC